MPIGSLTNGESGLSVRGKLNSAIDMVNRPVPFFGDPATWSRPALSDFSWLNRGKYAYSVANAAPGSGYVPGDTALMAGGSGASPATLLTVVDTKAVTATIVSAGTGGVPGPGAVTGTTGVGGLFILNVTIGVGGGITSIDSIADGGQYTTNPTVLTNEPVTDGAALAGAAVHVTMGAFHAALTNPGAYATAPSSPVSQASSSGAGISATWTIGYSSLATTTDVASGPLAIQFKAEGNFSALTALLKTIGSPPWTITVALAAVNTGLDDVTFLPIVLYDSGAKAAVCAGWTTRNAWLGVLHYASTIPGNAPSEIMHAYLPFDYFEWFRIRNDGVNITFGFSAENAVYLDVHTEAAPTVTHWGYGLDRGRAIDMGDQGLSVLWNAVIA